MKAIKYSVALPLFLLALGTLFTPVRAAAGSLRATTDCSASGSPALPAKVQLAELDVPRDLPVGGVIPNSKVSISWDVSCKSTGITGGKHWALFFQSPAVSIVAVDGLDRVYKQVQNEVAGVGFRFRDASGSPLSIVPLDGYAAALDFGAAVAGQTSFKWSGSIELVKTAGAISAGSQELQPQLGVAGQVWGNGTGDGSYFKVGYSIRKPALTTCSVINATQAVTLPTISQSALGMSSMNVDDGPSTAGGTPFTISLQCQKGARLYMLMTDANFPGSESSLLFPKGKQWGQVGVKIEREDGSDVRFAPDSSAAGAKGQWLIGDTPDGVLSIPLRAWYHNYKCGSCASNAFPVGAVSVQATYTFSYQ